MKLYLAASFSRQQEMRDVARRLFDKSNGRIQINSRWLTEKENRLENAFMDVEDVRACNILVRFTDNPEGDLVPRNLISGGRMFEFGMAWERGIPVIVVGGTQNIFDYLPNVRHVRDMSELEEVLGL